MRIAAKQRNVIAYCMLALGALLAATFVGLLLALVIRYFLHR